MAELYFYYGCMGSSKTAQALMMKYNYEQQGKKVMLLKPSVDTRTPPDLVQSRIGLRSKAISVKKNDNIKDICLMNPGRNSRDFSHRMDRTTLNTRPFGNLGTLKALVIRRPPLDLLWQMQRAVSIYAKCSSWTLSVVHCPACY